MRLLLDTHLLVWLLIGDVRVNKEARNLIEDPSNDAFASAISIWEVAIKWPLRRDSSSDMPFSGSVFAEALEAAGIEILDSTPAHALALEDLPPLHRDPFDRLLLATARAERMTLVTCDEALAKYGKDVRQV